MPGLEKLLRGILLYRVAVKPDMMKQFQQVRDHPEVKFHDFMVDFDRVIAKVSVKVTPIYGSVVGLQLFTITHTLVTVYCPEWIRAWSRFLNSIHHDFFVIENVTNVWVIVNICKPTTESYKAVVQCAKEALGSTQTYHPPIYMQVFPAVSVISAGLDATFHFRPFWLAFAHCLQPYQLLELASYWHF